MLFTVRQAQPDDAEAAVQVVRRSITESCRADHRGDAGALAWWLSNKTVQHFVSWFANDDNFCVIAEADGRLVGVGLLHRGGAINLLYLAPDAQRQGVGSAIHSALEEKARAWGLPKLKLDSTVLACPFYARLGYRPGGAASPRFGVLHSYPYEKTLEPAIGRQPDLENFETRLRTWCQSEPDVVAAAIVGSYARNEARPDSDLDVIILSNTPARLVHNTEWIARLGEASAPALEDWGGIVSLRTRFADGLEVEFGIGHVSWADVPPDPGTRRVVSDGMRVVYDPTGLLHRLRNSIA